MSDDCTQFRDAWFEATAVGGASADPVVGAAAVHGEPGHAEACDACARWVAAVQRNERVLADLASYPAPRGLDERALPLLADVAAGISLQPRAIRALRMLPELSAPAELEAAVFQTSADELVREPWRTPWCVQGLRNVEPHAAPRVLERLVREELADPRAALARRFPGDLERAEVPVGLAARVRRELSVRYRPSLVRAALPFATAAAAVLLVWIGLTGRGGTPGGDGVYSFRVIHADSPAELSGVAQGFASALGGGIPLRTSAPVRSHAPGEEAE